MKLEQLNENAALKPFSKKLFEEFKALMNDERYSLSITTAQGWPALTKDGVWFGGGFGPLGGKKAEAKAGDERLPLDVRVKAFGGALAKKLEELHKAGHTIKLAPGAERASAFEPDMSNLKAEVLKSIKSTYPPGGIINEDMPCLAWFVSGPKELANMKMILVDMSYLDTSGIGHDIRCFTLMPTKEASALYKKMKSLPYFNGIGAFSFYKLRGTGNKLTLAQAQKFVRAFVPDADIKDGVDVYTRLGGVNGKSDIQMSPEEFKKAIDTV